MKPTSKIKALLDDQLALGPGSGSTCRRPLRTTFVVALGAVALLLAGCASSSSSKSTTVPAAHPAPAYTVPPSAKPATPPRSPSGAAPTASAWRDATSRWLGTPHRLGGNDHSGIDCSGFALALYREVAATPLPRTTGAQWKTGRSVAPENLKAGDLVFFDINGQGVSHVGVYLDSNQFAHASTSKGVMISSLRETYWRTHFYGVRRVL